jgi:cobalamin biosynthesis protein CobT
MKYNGIQFRAAVEEVLGKVNNALGLPTISVKWARISTAAINCHGSILLADIQDDTVVDHATLVKYCGMGAHELCHHSYTDWGVVAATKAGTVLLQHLQNAVEDAYIERKAIRLGLTGNIESLFSSLINGMVSEALSEVTDWSDPAQYPFALAVYLRDHATVKVPLAQGLEPIFSEARRMFQSCDSSTDALKIAQWVEDQLKALPKGKNKGQDKGPEGQPDQSQPGQTSEGQPGEGESGQEGAQEGPQKGAGDAQKGEGEATPQPGPATRPEPGTQFRKVEPAVESPDPQGSGGAGGAYCEGDHLVRPGYHLNGGGLRADIVVPGALRYNLKRLFDNSALTEFGLRRRAGSVDVNALPRLGSSDRLFKRRSETEGIDSAVIILLDVSGSMRRNRIQPAVECCAALLDSLDRAQVATMVLTFGTFTSVTKQWSDRKAKAIAALSKVEAHGGTNDFFAVRYAHKLLSQRPEQRKVCIVLSDGCGQVDATARQVQAGEALGITTIGIGIQSDVSQVYPQSVTVDNLSDLGAASFKQIKLAV